MVPVTIVENLSVGFRHITMLSKILGYCNYIRSGYPQIGIKTGHSYRVGQFSRHQTGARWMTDSLLAVGAIKDHTLRGETIEVRSDDMSLPVAIQLRSQIVRCDEEDVGLVGSQDSPVKAEPNKKNKYANNGGAEIHIGVYVKMADSTI
jgi:hypothetical protein